MKFLVDNQLPPTLARFICQDLEGTDSFHVTDVDMESSSDMDIWRYASENGFIVVSKDEDFLTLVSKTPTAKLIWVRLGNCRRSYLLDAFKHLWPSILERFNSGDQIVELR